MTARTWLRALALALCVAVQASPAAWAADRREPPLPDSPLPAGQVLLPDLRTLPPSDLRIQLSRGQRRLRLANIIWNSGQGALEIRSQFNPDTRQTAVRQRLYADDGTFRDIPVGEFVWHPGHEHWHFTDFASYALWYLTQEGALDRVAVLSSKISYCIMETNAIDRERPDFSRRRRYVGCNRAFQGMSVGWGDEYESNLDGQEIDITQLPDGVYALVSTANPSGLVIEANYDNNAAVIYVEIRENQVTVVSPPSGPAPGLIPE